MTPPTYTAALDSGFESGSSPFLGSKKPYSPSPLLAPLSRKDEWVVMAVLMGLATLLCGLMLNPWLTVVNLDSAIFTLIAQSLAEGQGYVLQSGPTPEPYFTFPPLLPTVMALIAAVFGLQPLSSHQVVFKALIHGAFVLSIPLYYLWLRTRFARWQATVLGLSLVLSPLFYKYSADVLSDVPYWALSITAIFAVTLFWQRLQTWQPSKGAFALALVTVALSVLLRQVGVALVLAMLVFLASHHQWKRLAVSAGVLIVAAAFWPGAEHLYRSTHPVAADTLNQAGVQELLEDSPVKLEFIKHFLVHSPVSDDKAHVVSGPVELAGQIGKRVWAYSQLMIEQLFPPAEVRWLGIKGNLFDLLIVPIWGVLALGLLSLCRAYPMVGWYLLFYWGIFALYPYVSPRFMVPVLPLMMAALLLGWLNALRVGVQLGKGRWPKAALKKAYVMAIVGVLLVVLAAGQVPQTVRWVKAGYRLKNATAPSLKPQNAAYYQALLWVKTHTPPDTLLITRKPPVAAVYAHRSALAFPFTQNTGAVLRYILEKNATYANRYSRVLVIEDGAFGETERYLSPALRQFSDYFAPVHQTQMPGQTGYATRIYQLRPVRG